MDKKLVCTMYDFVNASIYSQHTYKYKYKYIGYGPLVINVAFG